MWHTDPHGAGWMYDSIHRGCQKEAMNDLPSVSMFVCRVLLQLKRFLPGWVMPRTPRNQDHGEGIIIGSGENKSAAKYLHKYPQHATLSGVGRVSDDAAKWRGQALAVYGLMSNPVLKTENRNHLHIQNMNKKFIKEVVENLSCYHFSLPSWNCQTYKPHSGAAVT